MLHKKETVDNFLSKFEKYFLESTPPEQKEKAKEFLESNKEFFKSVYEKREVVKDER